MTDFTRYSDIILAAYRSHAKPQEVVQKKQEILDSVCDYYCCTPNNVLFIGFNPAIVNADDIYPKVYVTEVSDTVLSFLDKQGISYEYIADGAGQEFDLVVALDEYLTFTDSDIAQKEKIEFVCGITKQIAVTTVKDYKNQEYKDREYSQPAVLRNGDDLNTFVEIHDWDFRQKNSWNTSVYVLNTQAPEFLGTYQRRALFFKQMAKFSLDTGASDFRVHKNLMYKSVLKKNYEHVITVFFDKR